MKLIRYCLFCTIILFTFSGCDKQNQNSDIDNFDENTFSEYTIYSTILNEGFERLKKPLVIQQTSNKESISFESGIFDNYVEPQGIDRSLFEEVLSKSDSVFDLENKFDIAPRVVQLIDSQALEETFMENGVILGWENFYQNYPDSGGYIRFSRVGFNEEKDQALVEYAHVYGGLGADGGFIYLEREGDSWQLRKLIAVWVS